MFFYATAFATALLGLPLVSALSLNTPTNWQSSSEVNISWTSTSTDVPFSFELVNTDEFHDTFALANNVNPTLNFLSFQLGVVPAGQYTLNAVNVTNLNQIYSSTSAFNIAAAPTTTSTSTSTSASVGTSSGTTGTGSSITSPAVTGTSTSKFGTTVTGATTTNTGSTGTSGTSSSSSGSTTPSAFSGSGAVGSVLEQLLHCRRSGLWLCETFLSSGVATDNIGFLPLFDSIARLCYVVC
ncbi:hypothetical protein A0H81_01280 [Grifola frondosa]|uniref:Uncharacterized protein n=1 Tax=Grifola frondosa TaxID=5627 RepID=A0A1C7MS48_GRIFR|nr:hypothetical protein A0H81_01280 [Grifola frondosa]